MQYKELCDGVYTISGFWTQEQCKEWINFGERKGFETASLNTGTEKFIDQTIRNNDRITHEDFDLANGIWKDLVPFVPAETEYGLAIGLNERFRIYKYGPGQAFKPHQDGSFMRNIHEWSSYTFMIYLNEDCKGGQTKFPSCEVEPETGKALIFKHELIHEGCCIEEGLKYVLRTDVMYKRKPKKDA